MGCAKIARILVHGDLELNEGGGSFFVQPAHPGRDRGRGDLQAGRRLGQRPATGSPKLEDGHAVKRGVVGPLVGRDTECSGVLDSHFFGQENILAAEAAVFGLLPDKSVSVVDCMAVSRGQGHVSQGDGVEDGRADAAWPSSGQGSCEKWRAAHVAPGDVSRRSATGLRSLRSVWRARFPGLGRQSSPGGILDPDLFAEQGGLSAEVVCLDPETEPLRCWKVGPQEGAESGRSDTHWPRCVTDRSRTAQESLRKDLWNESIRPQDNPLWINGITRPQGPFRVAGTP